MPSDRDCASGRDIVFHVVSNVTSTCTCLYACKSREKREREKLRVSLEKREREKLHFSDPVFPIAIHRYLLRLSHLIVTSQLHLKIRRDNLVDIPEYDGKLRRHNLLGFALIFSKTSRAVLLKIHFPESLWRSELCQLLFYTSHLDY